MEAVGAYFQRLMVRQHREEAEDLLYFPFKFMMSLVAPPHVGVICIVFDRVDSHLVLEQDALQVFPLCIDLLRSLGSGLLGL